jgi:hypothetical protein
MAPGNNNNLPVRRMPQRILVGILWLLALCAPLTAFGQLSLPDLAGQRGIHAGAFQFWPRLVLQGGYDSNVFYVADEDVSEAITAPMLLVTPGLRIENPQFKDIHLILDAAGTYRQYFSGNSLVDDNQSNFGADIKAGAEFYPRRMASLDLFDTFVHRVDTPNYSTSKTFNRIANRAGVKVAVHPGGFEGRKAFEVALEYNYDIDRYLDYDTLGQDQHSANLMAYWKFFPKTALLLDVDFALRSWEEGAAVQGRTESMPLRVNMGLDGFVTKKIAVTLTGGYGQGFYESGEDYQSFLADVSVTYSPLSTTILTVGYERDFVDSFYANYYVFDRFYFEGAQRLWDRLDLKVKAGYHLLNFSEFNPASAGTGSDGLYNVTEALERSDSALDVKASVDLDVTRFFAFQLEYAYRQVFSDFQQFVSVDETVSGDDVLSDVGGYAKHLIMGGVRIQY